MVLVKTISRLWAAIALLALPSVAAAASLTVTGRAGYLSEWELSATAEERTVAGKKEFSGPLTLKHVGVCSANGPVEKTGEIHLRMSGLFSPRLKATLKFEGVECTVSGTRSDIFDGDMNCSDARVVPLSLSVK